jgi:hypothetical protein
MLAAGIVVFVRVAASAGLACAGQDRDRFYIPCTYHRNMNHIQKYVAMWHHTCRRNLQRTWFVAVVVVVVVVVVGVVVRPGAAAASAESTPVVVAFVDNRSEEHAVEVLAAVVVVENTAVAWLAVVASARNLAAVVGTAAGQASSLPVACRTGDSASHGPAIVIYSCRSISF